MSKTIHIAIDGNEANVSQRVGSNSYAYEIIRQLEKICQARPEIIVTVLLTGSPLADLPTARTGWSYRSFGPSKFWTQYALSVHLWQHRHDYDVLFSPGHYGPRLSAIPYVSSVMDLAFLYFPEQFKKKDYLQLREWTRYSVKHARKVIAISEHTKHDVMEKYHVPAERIVVAYPSVVASVVDDNFKEKEKIAILKRWHIKQPFLLYVGTLQPRKNLLRLVEAFEKLHLAAKDNSQLKLHELQLVIAGKTGWLADDILKRIQHSPVRQKIILTGFVTDQEKVVLYKESLCTILVGLYEGFGIPVLEAMRYGSVPIASATTSLPEVMGEAGILVQPTDVLDIMRGIKTVVSLPAKERGKLLKNGRQQLKKFSWQKSAEIILQTLLDVAHK